LTRATPQDRLLPQSLDAEKAVLGAMLISPVHAGVAARDKLSGAEFYSSANLVIFGTIGKLIDEGKAPDLTMVVQRLKDTGHLDDVGGALYLHECMDACPSVANVEHHIAVVLEKATRRTLIGLAHEITERSYDSGADIEQTHSEACSAILGAVQTTDGIQSTASAGVEGLKQYEEAVTSERHLLGLGTGFSDLDYFMRGLEKEMNYYIAGRPGTGKTCLMLAIALYVAGIEGKPVGIISLEQSAKALVMRMAASIAEVNIRHPKSLNQEQHDKVVEAVMKVRKLPIYIDDRPALRLNQIRATSRVMKATHGCEMIWMDHLHITGRNKKQNELDHLTEMTGGIHQIAKELKIPFGVLAQLNRDLEKDNRQPRLSDLRSSGSAEQDGDCIALLSQVTVKEREKLPSRLKELDKGELGKLVRVNLAKQREGSAGPYTNVYLAFEKEWTKFRPVKYPETEQKPDWHEGPAEQ
jgi:replicative DNA helicase